MQIFKHEKKMIAAGNITAETLEEIRQSIIAPSEKTPAEWLRKDERFAVLLTAFAVIKCNPKTGHIHAVAIERAAKLPERGTPFLANGRRYVVISASLKNRTIHADIIKASRQDR